MYVPKMRNVHFGAQLNMLVLVWYLISSSKDHTPLGIGIFSCVYIFRVQLEEEMAPSLARLGDSLDDLVGGLLGGPGQGSPFQVISTLHLYGFPINRQIF